MERTTSERRGRSDRAALVGLTVLTLTVTLLAYSPAAVPLIDDWIYAWSVHHFLQTGALRMLEWSSHYPLAQILWGALFSHLCGFSFAIDHEDAHETVAMLVNGLASGAIGEWPLVRPSASAEASPLIRVRP